MQALTEQVRELEWRLNVVREDDSWVDPDPELPPVDEDLLDGFIDEPI
jgi:hypothetical protein